MTVATLEFRNMTCKVCMHLSAQQTKHAHSLLYPAIQPTLMVYSQDPFKFLVEHLDVQNIIIVI